MHPPNVVVEWSLILNELLLLKRPEQTPLNITQLFGLFILVLIVLWRYSNVANEDNPEKNKMPSPVFQTTKRRVHRAAMEATGSSETYMNTHQYFLAPRFKQPRVTHWFQRRASQVWYDHNGVNYHYENMDNESSARVVRISCCGPLWMLFWPVLIATIHWLICFCLKKLSHNLATALEDCISVVSAPLSEHTATAATTLLVC